MRRVVFAAATGLAIVLCLGFRPWLAASPDTTTREHLGRRSVCAKSFSWQSSYILGAARVPGYNDTQWRTSLEVCNFGAMTQLFELAFLYRGQANPAPETTSLTLAPGLCIRYTDVVQGVFRLDEAAGTIRVESSGDGIVALARTYNDTPDGTYGSIQPALAADTAIVHGETAALVHLSQSADDGTGFRANLDLLNTTDSEITIEIALYDFAGNLYDTLTTTLLPYEYDQVLRVFRQVTQAEVWDGYAMVQTTSPDGAVLVSASLIDNRTGDTTAIQALRPPVAEGWQEPSNLGSVINTASDDWYPVIARDGSFMIFVSDRPGGHGGSDLYISRRVAGEWQAPANLGPNVNTAEGESAPYLGPGDNSLYFASFAPGGVGTMDIWWCPLDDGVPGERVNPGEPINTPLLDCCPVISADGNTMYMCSTRSGGFGAMDAWVSHRVEGVWQEPTNLGEHVNSSATDCPRWLSDDGTTLILSSTRTDGYGDADLWYLLWRGDDWSRPINFGAPVNSSRAEWGPGFLDNAGVLGGTMFFGSGRSGGQGGWDIWLSDFGSPGMAAAASLPATVPGYGERRNGLRMASLVSGASPQTGTTPGTVEAGLLPDLIDRLERAGKQGPSAGTEATSRPSSSKPSCYCSKGAPG